jgi:phosphatidylserine/phosphatidylglycerophosphate/cardiolipin synthase-like enzyme
MMSHHSHLPLLPALALALAVLGCTSDPGEHTGDPTDTTEPCTGASGFDDPATGLPDLRCTQAANNRDYFWFARESIEAARERVHLIEYLLYDTGQAELLLEELLDAAGRGVEVKLLADESVEETSDTISWLRSASGGAVDAKLDSSSTVSHNKLIIVDGVTLVGSHNMSSSALGDNNEASLYLVEPEVTAFYEAYFQSMWADSDVDPSLDKPADSAVEPIKNREIGEALKFCLDDAQQRVRLVMYAIAYRPGEGGDVTSLVNRVVEAHERGVDVQVILDQSDWIASNHINDEAIDLFLAHGVTLRLADRDRTTHAKVLLCDDSVIVGDANWSYSSMEEYNGTSVRVTRADIAQQYLDWFGGIWDEAEEP